LPELFVLHRLIPPPVSIGPRASGLPEHEIDVINAARIAGKSEEEIRSYQWVRLWL